MHGSGQRGVLRAGRVERPVDQAGEPDGDPRSADGHERRLDGSPGSNRIAAARRECASRMPYAAARSNDSRGFTSKKWKCDVMLTGTSPVLVTVSVHQSRRWATARGPR